MNAWLRPFTCWLSQMAFFHTHLWLGSARLDSARQPGTAMVCFSITAGLSVFGCVFKQWRACLKMMKYTSSALGERCLKTAPSDPLTTFVLCKVCWRLHWIIRLLFWFCEASAAYCSKNKDEMMNLSSKNLRRMWKSFSILKKEEEKESKLHSLTSITSLINSSYL